MTILASLTLVLVFKILVYYRRAKLVAHFIETNEQVKVYLIPETDSDARNGKSLLCGQYSCFEFGSFVFHSLFRGRLSCLKHFAILLNRLGEFWNSMKGALFQILPNSSFTATLPFDWIISIADKLLKQHVKLIISHISILEIFFFYYYFISNQNQKFYKLIWSE
jgi:hypothetical protein